MKFIEKFNAIAVASLGLGCLASSAAVKVEEQIVASKSTNIGCAVGPHGTHVVAVMPKGSRTVVVCDGVEGPRFDHVLFGSGGEYNHPISGAINVLNNDPIIFSPDGAHYAYLARSAGETVVMQDNKELSRGSAQDNYRAPFFSPDGSHLCVVVQSDKGYQLQIDGKAGPISADPLTATQGSADSLVFSADGAHYAYIGTERNGERTKWSVIDGKQVKYFGEDLKFTANGHLLSVLTEPGAQTLILDGKGVLKALYISRVWTSPTGAGVVAYVTPREGAPTVLTFNGKPIAGSEGLRVADVYFSPDRKHLAALCSAPGAAQNYFMLFDGKKGDSYQSIDNSSIPPKFSADSSRFIYVAQNGGQMYLVVNGEETDACLALVPKPVFAGTHFAYGLLNNGKSEVYIDGKLAITAKGEDTFSLSPDGSRWAMVVAKTLRVDGSEFPNLALTEWTSITPTGQMAHHSFAFSPDSKHIAYLGADPTNPKRCGLFIDQTLVFTAPNNFPGAIKRLDFSPDGQHIFWTIVEQQAAGETQQHHHLYVDGEPSVKYALSQFDTYPAAWDIGADGTLQLIKVADDGLKRVRVTPSTDSSITTLIAQATNQAH